MALWYDLRLDDIHSVYYTPVLWRIQFLLPTALLELLLWKVFEFLGCKFLSLGYWNFSCKTNLCNILSSSVIFVWSSKMLWKLQNYKFPIHNFIRVKKQKCVVGSNKAKLKLKLKWPHWQGQCWPPEGPAPERPSASLIFDLNLCCSWSNKVLNLTRRVFNHFSSWVSLSNSAKKIQWEKNPSTNIKCHELS